MKLLLKAWGQNNRVKFYAALQKKELTPALQYAKYTHHVAMHKKHRLLT